MTGTIILQEKITPADVAQNRKILYVFGDNLAQVGSGPYSGQAWYGRDQLNTVGIPTKREPYHYMSDEDYNINTAAIGDAFMRLKSHLDLGGIIVWPSGGVGTGRARLRTIAPKTWRFLMELQVALFQEADKDMGTDNG